MTDTNRQTGLDKLLAALPYALAGIVILMILFWEAAVRKTPTIFSDELEWAQLSRAIAATGHAARRGEPISFKSLYSFLIAPAWWLHSTATAYTAIKYLNTLVMATASIPVFLLARRLVSARAAGVAALGSLCTSASYYAPLLIPEVLAYPTACLCAYACVRALAGDGRRWTVAAVVLCIIAVKVRSELVCEAGAFAIAAIVIWTVGPRGRRLRSRWGVPGHIVAAVLVVLALIEANKLVSPHAYEWATVTRYWQDRIWHLGFEAGSALVIGLGILPAVAGLASLWLPERRADPGWRAFAAFLAASVVTFGTYTGVKAAYLSTVFGTYVEERNLIYLSPLLIVGAAVYFSARRPSLLALFAAAAFCGWLVLAHGYQLLYPYFEAPGYGITAMANRSFGWDQPTIRLGLLGVLAIGLAFALTPFVKRLAPVRHPLALCAGVLVATFTLAGEVTSARGSQTGANQLVANLPQPLDWVDQRTNGAGVTYLGQDIGVDIGLSLTEFWNRSIKHVWTLDGTAPGPGPTQTPDLVRTDGTLSHDPGIDYVLEDNGVRLVGRVVEQNQSLILLRTPHPWRLRETYYGRSNDGWIANDGTYAYFGPARAGVLHLDVSRRGFCAESAPPTRVVVRVGPVALNEQRAPVVQRATAVRSFLLHSCEQVPLRFRVSAPVAAAVHIDRVVKLSDYGISDSRTVGAQIGASFSPNATR